MKAVSSPGPISGTSLPARRETEGQGCADHRRRLRHWAGGRGALRPRGCGFWLARAALKRMKRGAAIIASSSVTGILGSKELPDYSATKGAINAFTKALAMEVIDLGIRVNAVAPGPVWTPLNAADPGLSPEKVAEFGSHHPMGRPAQPEELAPAYVFLASDADSSFITGTVMEVMGGRTTGG